MFNCKLRTQFWKHHLSTTKFVPTVLTTGLLRHNRELNPFDGYSKYLLHPGQDHDNIDEPDMFRDERIVHKLRSQNMGRGIFLRLRFFTPHVHIHVNNKLSQSSN